MSSEVSTCRSRFDFNFSRGSRMQVSQPVQVGLWVAFDVLLQRHHHLRVAERLVPLVQMKGVPAGFDQLGVVFQRFFERSADQPMGAFEPV